MKSIQQRLLEFDKAKEHIPRQVTSVRPVRECYPEAGKGEMLNNLKTGKSVVFDRERNRERNREMQFEQDGISGVIETSEEAIEVATSLAMYNFSVKNALLSDLAAGLYSMVTTGAGLYDKRTLLDSETGEATHMRITASRETLWKAMFGPLVDDNGRGLPGTSDLLKDSKKNMALILNKTEMPPKAYASIYRINAEGRKISAVIAGNPVMIEYGIMKRRDGNGNMIMTEHPDAVTILLDMFFYPVHYRSSENNNGKSGARYIHQIAGLTTFLQYGSREANRLYKKSSTNDVLSPERRPDILTMRRILLSSQAAFELGRLYPGIVKNNQSDRINIVLKRTAVRELYPSAYTTVKNKDFYRYKLFSQAVAHTGMAYSTAMNLTGITEQVIKQGKLLIIATDKGAEFPGDHPNKVYIKADKK